MKYLVSKVIAVLRRIKSSVLTTLYVRKTPAGVFETNYSFAKTHYLEARKNYNYQSFLEPLWATSTRTIENFFVSEFSNNFLRHPVIRSTMCIDNPRTTRTFQKQLITTTFGDKAQTYLEETRVGNLFISDSTFKTSGNTIHHLYHLAKLCSTTPSKNLTLGTVIEWGGGYGNMARIIKKINPFATYVIFDIPVFSHIQYVYLATTLGAQHVTIFNGDRFEPGKITLVPLDETLLHKATELINKSLTPDLFLSTWALSESNEKSKAFVREHEFFHANTLLIAYQKNDSDFHEAEQVTALPPSYQVTYHEPVGYTADSYYLFAKRTG